MDLIVRNSRLRGRSELLDIGVSNGIIVEIKEEIAEHASNELNADGNLTTPSFIDPHEHLDTAMIGELVRPNKSGTLFEAIEILREAKKKFTVEDVKERAVKAIRKLVENGTTIIRSHANVDSFAQLTSINGLVEARNECRDLVTLQIVAFPQEGIIRDAGSEELMRRSMELGADIVGGMPASENTEEDSKKHIDIVYEIAKEFSAGIDMHIDENCDPNSRSLHYFAAKAIKAHYPSNITASHACALTSYDDYYATKVIGLVKAAEMNIIANPCTNLMLQGRLDKHSIRRGVTRVKELNAAGVNVACGQDGVNDSFDPLLAKCDMLQVAWLMGHVSHLSTPSEVELLFDMITKNAAIALGIKQYGLTIGNEANINVLDAKDIYQAIRMQSDRLYVIRSGNLVSGTKVASLAK
jgi:cytosine deaminase